MSGLFSRESVWSQETRTGFKQQVLLMYHGTSAANAESILENGFRLSVGQNQMLGNGVYASMTMEKARRYGPVILRMLVYPGRVIKITCQDHPMQKKWHEDYGSAWVPPNCGMVNSGLEENCIKSSSQIKILGVCRGWSYLSCYAKSLTRNCSNQRLCELSVQEDQDLDDFVCDLGLEYTRIRCSLGYLSDNWYDGGEPRFVPNPESSGDDLYWTVTWDGALENKLTGRVLMMKENRRLVMTKFVEDGANSKYQKWKLDAKKNALVSRYFREPVYFTNADGKGRWYDRSKFTPFYREHDDVLDDSYSDNSDDDCDDSNAAQYYEEDTLVMALILQFTSSFSSICRYPFVQFSG